MSYTGHIFQSIRMRVGVLMHFDLLNPNLETEMIYLSYFFLVNLLKNYLFCHFSGFANQTLSQLLIELESSSKNQKNPHGLLIWGGDTFQTSSYHSFSLKPGRVKNTPSLMKFQWLSYFCMIFINLVYLKAELSSQTNNLLVFYTIIFTRHSRLLRASERCFCKLTCFT